MRESGVVRAARTALPGRTSGATALQALLRHMLHKTRSSCPRCRNGSGRALRERAGRRTRSAQRTTLWRSCLESDVMEPRGTVISAPCRLVHTRAGTVSTCAQLACSFCGVRRESALASTRVCCTTACAEHSRTHSHSVCGRVFPAQSLCERVMCAPHFVVLGALSRVRSRP